MMHCVIIDDELSGVISLKLLISKFVPDLKVVATTTVATEGVDLINDFRPDIVFLDINMPVLNGFELIDKISYRDFHLVFTTAHNEFGVRAIRQNAMDYLLKPIDEVELNATIERIKLKNNETSGEHDIERLLAQLKEKRNRKVPLNTKTDIGFVRPEDIIYIEADSNHSTVAFLNGNSLEVSTSLKEYETFLCNEDLSFMRVHNSFIINTNYITRYQRESSGSVVMKGGKIIPVSKKNKEQLLQALGIPFT